MLIDPPKARPGEPSFWDRDPVFGPITDPDLLRWGVRVLDPAGSVEVPGVEPRPTVYLARTLLLSTREAGDLTDKLAELARPHGWTVTTDESLQHRVESEGEPVGVVRLVLGMTPGADPVDAWTLLQEARLELGLEAARSVGLEHVIEIHPAGHVGSNPAGHVGSNPAGHVGSNPFEGSPSAAYGSRGDGGRQPVAYTGAPPARLDDDAWQALGIGGRPVVGVLDSGCGAHDWLTHVDESVSVEGRRIGFEGLGDRPDPETGGDHRGPLDGVLDQLSGHGTFICGLVHQQCPDAEILSWRIVPSEGYVPEGAMLDALVGIARLVQLWARGEPEGRRIDVLNVSMGYYHETPEEDLLVNPVLRAAVRVLGESGTCLVASAGNDATARRLFPAALAADASSDRQVRVVAVGARNPNPETVALFSNTGDWVTTYAPDASVLSTMPPLRGGLEPVARRSSAWGERAGIDPDDFAGGAGGGFAVWSGTSFAAPVVAGRIAARVRQLQAEGAGDEPESAVGRVSKAVAEVVRMTP